MKMQPDRTDRILGGLTDSHQTKSGWLAKGERGETFGIDVLENDLIRVHMYPQGEACLTRTWLILDKNGEMPESGRERSDYSPFSLPSFTFEQKDDFVFLSTSMLKLKVDFKRLAMLWSTPDGLSLAEDDPRCAYGYETRGQGVMHNMQNHAGEHFYGFGEVSGSLNKAGKRIFLKNVDIATYNARNGSPLYKQIPFYITLKPKTGQAYGLFYDNLATTVFEMGNTLSRRRGYRAEAGDIDYYFIYGPSIQEVVAKFTRLTGRMVLPPRWTLGYLGSTKNYTDAPDAQVQLEAFCRRCKEYKIPCDMFHLSSGYTLGDDGKRYVFRWNRNRVPQPKEMIENFHRNGIKLAANVKPALLTCHPSFEELRSKKAFIRQSGNDDAQIFDFWGGPAAALDFTNPVTVDWWKQNIKEQLLDLDIDSIWNDNNEFEIWTKGAYGVGFGTKLPIELSRPLQTLMMARASYDAMVENRPDKRPFVISRAGMPGMQRYVQTWSGDNCTSWETMKFNVPMGLNLGLSGVANNGHDTGGYAGPRPAPELFLRWIQNNIFHPRFTIHSSKPEAGASEPWMYPDIFPQVREAIYLRYRLIPYLYMLEVESSHTGCPIMRPLVYEFSADPNCLDESFEYMLGSSLLVAPVTKPGLRMQTVYLPAGHRWYDFYTDHIYEGGRKHKIPAPLDHIPLFVIEGGMIPMGEVVHPLVHAEDDLRQIFVFPICGKGNSSMALIEDDGCSMDYKRGILSKVSIELQSDGQCIDCEIRIDPYKYSLPYKELELIFPTGEERLINCPGLMQEWIDENKRRHIKWPIPMIHDK